MGTDRQEGVFRGHHILLVSCTEVLSQIPGPSSKLLRKILCPLVCAMLCGKLISPGIGRVHLLVELIRPTGSSVASPLKLLSPRRGCTIRARSLQQTQISGRSVVACNSARACARSSQQCQLQLLSSQIEHYSFCLAACTVAVACYLKQAKGKARRLINANPCSCILACGLVCRTEAMPALGRQCRCEILSHHSLWQSRLPIDSQWQLQAPPWPTHRDSNYSQFRCKKLGQQALFTAQYVVIIRNLYTGFKPCIKLNCSPL